jgi:hypothetical protein
MRKMLTFAILGGTVGAGIAIAKTTSGPVESASEDENTTMKTVGGAALAGAAVGLLLDRRAKKHAKHVAKGAKMAAAVAGAAKAAKPRIEQAIEAGRPRLEQAIEASRPHLEHAAEATREVAMNAAEAARTRLAKAA